VDRSGVAWRPVVVSALVVALFLSSGFVLKDRAAAATGYKVELSVRQVSANLENYFGTLLLRPGGVPARAGAGLLAFLAAVAVITRSRHLLFGLALFLPGLALALVVPQRSLYMLYVPLLGLWLYAAWFLWRLASPIRVSAQWRGAALMAVVIALLAPRYREFKPHGLVWAERERDKVGRVLRLMESTCPVMPQGSRVLFLDDDMEDDWVMLFLLRLKHHDPTLEVLRARHGMDPPPAPADWPNYRFVYGWENGRFVQVAGAACGEF
jgi:hypothetical protein